MKSKKILFRADGNSSVGLGHLYRLFSLVEMLKTEYDFYFLTKEDSELSVIPSSYPLELIPKNISYEMEPDWIRNRYDVETFIIIADGYQFGSEYQKNIKQEGFKLVYIDDLAGWEMFADAVINHSPGVTENDYTGQNYTSYALGTKFALLRPKFLDLAKVNRNIEKIDSVFICFGGADPDNLTLKSVKGVLDIHQIKKINIVLGGAYKSKEIYSIQKLDKRINIFQNLSEDDMVKVMLDSHLAIVPSSTILFEVCSVKMPVLSGYFVDNQRGIYSALKEKNIIISGDNFSFYSKNDFKLNVQKIIDLNKYSQYTNNQKKHFDGKSKLRLIGLINRLNLYFRKANKDDVYTIYNWSNDPLVRKNSYDSNPILIENHKEWYDYKIISKDSLMLIGMINSKKVALVRYDIKEDYSVVGILIDKKFRGQGIAPEFLKVSAEIYFCEFSKPILAYIKKDNVASKISFEKANYKYYKEEIVKGSDSYIYKLEKNEFR
ncbi:UDP-2,4-diacetamido-2,4,6-trideoxy-beta-L-altropyranose hydrolase [Tenacibaculum sp. 190524A05c]|uniref:UDP-2,4-diacetamido-2,4, 6-trideoxy-beta-L-altropyranose hydrolase n=1 Tax=Tenacibaculum platacis TaxID=3137852 RepID=UPI0032B1F814